MKVQKVRRVVGQIIPLLASYGQQDKAGWLGNESALLGDARLSDMAVSEAFQRLHRIVPGMGGLMDLPLAGLSREEETIARETLDKLANELYELTDD